MTMRRLALLLAALTLTLPAPASAQLFFSTPPESGLRVGPLIVRANVTPDLQLTRVNVLFSVLVPSGARSGPLEDLYLLWPGEVKGDARLSARDPALARYVESLGFDVIGEGRLALFAQHQRTSDSSAVVTAVAGGAPYVVFVQSGGPLGLSPPATWIRIPATPKLTDPTWLMDLQIPSVSAVKPRSATWIENAALGVRYIFSMGFNEVRDRPLFAMYFAHRDRVVRLGDAPAELVVNFSDAGRLKVDQVYPLNTLRRLSETLESTEVVSLFLDTSEGITPQQLSVQFGYFSRTQAVLVLVVPMLVLVLGYAVGPLVGRMALHLALLATTRVHLGGWSSAPRDRESGVVLSQEVLAKITPGVTTFDEAVALCGPGGEVAERYPSSGRRTLVYRGRRVRPQARRIFGWFYSVRGFDVEQHEVTIEFDGNIVRDVQAAVRRAHLRPGETP